MTALEKQILSLQQKVEQLNGEMLTLLALTSIEQPATDKPAPPKTNGHQSGKTSASKSPIGINRYRQFRAGE